MDKRSSKANPAEDPNETAFRVIDEATREDGDGKDQPAKREKNPAAVELGKLGGQKGGPARAAKLSKERKSQIARKAAAARWRKTKGE